MPSDMLRGIHNTFKTCITWTQNVFRNHKAKTNKAKAKGRLGEKITAVVFVLTAFTFSLANLTFSDVDLVHTFSFQKIIWVDVNLDNSNIPRYQF